jgi:DNA replication and repair protein RecF
VTLITGSNGSGKTSLLEAVYIALQGSSFKGSDLEVLKHDSPWYRIDIEFDNGVKRSVKFDPSRQTGKKQFEVDNKTAYRLTFAHKYPVVLFEPDELRLLGGSPARRREFIDRFISQFDPEYALSLRRYERALKQRNSLLKHHNSNQNDLFVWDVSLSKYGAVIVERRTKIIEQLQPALESVYKDISHSGDSAFIHYSAQYKGSIEQKLLSELHQAADRDRRLGYTSVGPHRHDILFDLNGSSAAGTASRGEIRTIVLALKFLEVDIIKLHTDKPPIILLDDVFSELDESRQHALMDRFSHYQTIITSVTAETTEYPVISLSN